MRQRLTQFITGILRNLVYRCGLLYLRSRPVKRAKRLAIFKPDGIGDFVLSSGAIRELIAKVEPDKVTLIVSFEVYELAVECFPEIEILPIAPGHSGYRDKISRLPQLRSVTSVNCYDEVVCLRHYRTLYDNIILQALHATRVILLSNQSVAGKRSKLTPTPGNFCYVQPEFDALPADDESIPREWCFHAAVLSVSLGRSVFPESLCPNWRVRRMNPGAPPPFMLICPLAGRSIRGLPLPHVQAAARRACADGLAKFVVTGTRGQSAQLTQYAEALRADLHSCVVEVAHPPTLPALVRLVANAALILTAETSTAHIATALDKTALIIIGGGHYGWFAPWRRSEKQVWLTNKLPCFDCNWRCSYPEPICITGVTAAQVEAALPVAE
jgi:ADP-heptose:LPS heptosyltransferase